MNQPVIHSGWEFGVFFHLIFVLDNIFESRLLSQAHDYFLFKYSFLVINGFSLVFPLLSLQPLDNQFWIIRKADAYWRQKCREYKTCFQALNINFCNLGNSGFLYSDSVIIWSETNPIATFGELPNKLCLGSKIKQIEMAILKENLSHRARVFPRSLEMSDTWSNLIFTKPIDVNVISSNLRIKCCSNK